MGDQNVSKQNCENRLRSRARDILFHHILYEELSFVLSEWHNQGWGPILFGGFLRDLMVFGKSRNPRDIDIVVQHHSIADLVLQLKDFSPEQNRFGGIHLTMSHWNCDIWPLVNTWGFKHGPAFAPSFKNLPRTTFLNVEAVALEIGQRGKVGPIAEYGFFDSIISKTLEINLELNPYPALAAIRALMTAKKLNFYISKTLCRYILKTTEIAGVDSLIEAQRSHYGEVKFSPAYLRTILADIKTNVETEASATWRFDQEETHQMVLWGQ
jgi:hypothetical protein